jgi:hypothetical protein
MSHSSINVQVRSWAKDHSLDVSYGWAGRELWGTYLWSIAGECFQIWIEPITGGTIGVHANYVDGPKGRDPEPEEVWTVEESGLKNALNQAYEQVVNWMAPSARHFPRQ